MLMVPVKVRPFFIVTVRFEMVSTMISACKRLTAAANSTCAPLLPAVPQPRLGTVADHAQQRAVRIIVDDIHAGERQQAVGVCDVEHVAAAANEAAAGHREHGCADVRVAAHGLIDHHVVDVFRRARTLGVAHVAGDHSSLRA